MDLESITYFKMYGSSIDAGAERCFAFILMPASSQRNLVCLQSIQFACNAHGKVIKLCIVYSGHELDIEKKAKETMNAIIDLKLRHGKGEQLCVFDKQNRTFELEFNESQDYLSDIIDRLKDIYLMKTDFVQNIKSQLLNQEFLEKEYLRLRGKAPENNSACIIM